MLFDDEFGGLVLLLVFDEIVVIMGFVVGKLVKVFDGFCVLLELIGLLFCSICVFVDG